VAFSISCAVTIGWLPWGTEADILKLAESLPALGDFSPMQVLLGGQIAVLAFALAVLVHQVRHDRQRRELGQKEFYRREGLAVVGLSWLVAGIIGSFPFLFSGAIPDVVDAFFESISGFTTTGSTILSADGIDNMAMSIMFWRAFTHWLGGIGIVLVFVVLFPAGGRSLFRSEVPGVSREAVQQRVRDSGMGLMRVYVGLTLLQVVLYMAADLSLYEALVHAFGTLATGGFSSHSTSIAYFNSPLVEGITIAFMFAAGINFAIYDSTLRLGPKRGWRMLTKSSEIRLYAGAMGGAIVVITAVLWFWGGSNGDVASDLPDYTRLSSALRDSSFVVASVQTSTGYGTADFDQWPHFARMLLMGLAFMGACAGSTGGGLKVVRFMILAKSSLRSFQQFARPRAKLLVRMNGEPIDEEMVSSIVGYFGMWFLIFGAATLALAAMGIDPLTASTGVLATLNNIGPGLDMLGPTQSFGWMPDLGKLLCCVLMLIGRLEFYAIVVLFLPRFWRI
jgi:trk system potassium uptake protein TrkH